MISPERYLIENVKREWLEKYADSLQRHIEAVEIAGKKLGVREYQLAHHDDSKYSMQEFPFYARQFHGDAGDPDGFARAWLHHIHNNPHHWQHWMFPDWFTPKGSSVEAGTMEMPEEFALEMVADWMGASYVYTGDWDMTEWLRRNVPKITLHTKTRDYVVGILGDLGYAALFKREKEDNDRIQSGY
jgi:hypothetical protein